MTGAEFLAYVKNIYLRDDKDAIIYEATTDVIMDMRLRFLSEDFKEESYTSYIYELGINRMPVPENFGHLIGDISLTDTETEQYYPPLTKISKERYDDLYPDRLLKDASKMHTGRPLHFCIFAKQIYVGPVPDRITYRYQLNYTTESKEAIISTTVGVPFTDKYRKTLRYGVLWQVYELMWLHNEAQVWKQRYEEDLSKIASNDEFNTSSDEFIQYSGV